MKTKLILVVIITNILLSAQCKKHNDDPCKDKIPFKADFGIYFHDKYSRVKNGDTAIEIKDGDTCIGGYLTFATKNYDPNVKNYDSVHWVIGNSQNISNLNEYQLIFGVPESDIPVSLTGYKKHDYYNCFPSVQEVQTVTKKFSVAAPDNSIPIVGKFFGYNEDSPADTFTISTQFESSRYHYFVIQNFPKGNRGFRYGVLPPPIDSFIGIHPDFYGYNYIFIDNANGSVSTDTHGPLYGIAKIINRNKIEINYEQFMTRVGDIWSNVKQRKFIGIRK